jgi:hypothetical protein
MDASVAVGKTARQGVVAVRVQRIGDVSIIRDEVDIPGLGALAINAYVIHADEPVLVDTGRPVVRGEFMSALNEIIDPRTLRWIWLSHPDRDHMGALFDVLAAAPKARLVSTYFAVGYLSVEYTVPMDRVFLLNPGQTLDVGGGRKLHAFRPPLFDSPMTTGFYDDVAGYAFTSDCFGAPMPTLEAAQVEDLRDVPADAVRSAQLMWAGADSPWVINTDPAKFATTYDDLRRFAPNLVLSSHLPPAAGQIDTMLDLLAHAHNAPAFVGPDQATLEAMMAGALQIPDQAEAGAPIPH